MATGSTSIHACTQYTYVQCFPQKTEDPNKEGFAIAGRELSGMELYVNIHHTDITSKIGGQLPQVLSYCICVKLTGLQLQLEEQPRFSLFPCKIAGFDPGLWILKDPYMKRMGMDLHGRAHALNAEGAGLIMSGHNSNQFKMA